jgi:SAM-dependent methyltransferase
MGDRAERTEKLYAREYFLAIEGLAMLRHVLTEPSAIRARAEEVREIAAKFDEFPYSLEIPLTEHDVEEGYTDWAEIYDRPGNPAIDVEEPVVHGILGGLARGDALDAACGTGRHSRMLVKLGHRVIGVDTTEAMLGVAREKVPTADFRPGRLEALPVDDASVDVVVCALALTHVPDLVPVMREFARVLRPGGHAVLSDIHPMATPASPAAAPAEGGVVDGLRFVRNLSHPISSYVNAFVEAGLTIRECVEPNYTEEVVAAGPAYSLLPDAFRQAFLGLPFLLVWHLQLS